MASGLGPMKPPAVKPAPGAGPRRGGPDRRLSPLGHFFDGQRRLPSSIMLGPEGFMTIQVLAKLGVYLCDTYEGLIRSFEWFGGVPQEVLVDNQKAAVLTHRRGGMVEFHPRFVDLRYQLRLEGVRAALARLPVERKRVSLQHQEGYLDWPPANSRTRGKGQ
jgi:hypothetical protein